MGDRIDGHVVQGHVDTTGTLKAVEELDGLDLRVAHPVAPEWITVPKGGIALAASASPWWTAPQGIFSGHHPLHLGHANLPDPVVRP